MNSEIKKRVACLKSKGIPLDYQKTKAGIMPADWDGTIKARQVFKSHTDKKHDGDLEILAATQENGIVPRSQIDIDIKCSEEGISGYKRVDAGDFVISLRSFQGGIEYSLYDGIVSPAYTVLKPIKDIADEYYKNYFKTDDFIQRLNGAVYGIRDGKQISYEDFGDLYIHFPPFAEQQKIGEILFQCDKAIELKKGRLEEERKLKRILLRRFLENQKSNDGWICRGLSELCVFSEDGDWIETKDQSKEGIRLIQTGNVGVGRYLDKGHRARYISKETFERLNCTEVLSGDILISRLPDPIGRACRVPKMNERAITAVDCTILRFDNDLIARWILQYASSPAYFNRIKTLAGGSTRTRISRKELLNLLVYFPPDADEQKKVVEILEKQDRVINLLEDELAEWGQKKKALMQLLLTGIVRVNSK